MTGSSKSLTMALTGDSLISRRISIYDDDPTAQLLSMLRDSDVAFTNLESQPNDFQGAPHWQSGGTHLGARPMVLDELQASGFNLFACPSNHTLDYEIPGLLALLDILNQRGLCYAGIGRNLGEARMPAYLQTSRGTVGMIACASTFAPGQLAGEQRPDLQGRPGLNPLRYRRTYVIPEQHFSAVREMAVGLGLEARRLEAISQGFALPPDDPDVQSAFGEQFKPGADFAVETSVDPGDLEAITGWVAEAARRSDIVLVSIHAHEQGNERDEPAAFLVEFAHAVIDAGAHLVVGHGPHLLRGMELYKGRPIFYSLGNFVEQHELVERMPADAYTRYRVDPSWHPGELFAQRSRDDSGSYWTDERYWQTIVPVLRWDGQDLAGIEIHPVSLGFREPIQQRGRPKLALGEEAGRILKRFRALSQAFDVDLRIEDNHATI